MAGLIEIITNSSPAEARANGFEVLLNELSNFCLLWGAEFKLFHTCPVGGWLEKLRL